MKQCIICKLFKNETEFHKNKNRKDKLDDRCKSCKHENNILNKEKYKLLHRERYLLKKEEINRKNKEWYKNNPEKTKNQKLIYQYGITLEQRNLLIKNQNNKCKICLDDVNLLDSRSIHVDHNHLNGKVRGILCKKCNSMVGLSREKEYILNNAIKYLKEYQ